MKDLTALQVKNQREPGKHRVSRNLYLQVTDSGARSWLFRYMRHGAPHWHGLGSCDLVTLAEARDKALACRKLILEGGDPIDQHKAKRTQEQLEAAASMTFQACGKAYIAAHEAGWRNPKHRQQWRNTLDTYVYPSIGKLPVQAVDVAMVMKLLEPIWTAKPETAGRLRGRIESILDWATVRQFRTGDNPARWKGHLDQLLPKKGKIHKVRHQPAMHYRDVPAFMAELRNQTSTSARALEFTVLNTVRTGEATGATWPEIDREARVWTIPAQRIKAESRYPTARSPSWTRCHARPATITCSLALARVRACRIWRCSSCCAAWPATATPCTAFDRASATGAPSRPTIRASWPKSRWRTR
jgi:hypothetical protein